MLVDEREIKKYLEDFKSGKIKQGLGLGVNEIDKHLRFKQGTFNMILGHDNVGKTYWRTWYYLVLAVKYGKKFCIWTGENKAGQIVRNLIQFYTGKPFKELSISEIYRYQQEIAQYFTFVDNKKAYKYNELLTIFGEEDYTACLIDPYTGLDRQFTHSANYEFLNQTREWVNTKGVTIDVCTHPSTASGRQAGMYPKEHEWAGHLKEPYKADTEGGKPFANRTDDFIIIHRLPKHPTMKTYTLIYVDKIKDNETGGEQTEFDNPIMCDFNNGLGFKIAGVNPITEKETVTTKAEPKELMPNKDF